MLEDANIKLPSVASNALGKSDRAILQTIIKEEQSAERLADLAQGHLLSRLVSKQRLRCWTHD